MIAICGAKQLLAGDTVAIGESAVDSNYRPDQVAVTWRGRPEPAERSAPTEGASPAETVQGAEATVSQTDGVVTKRREPRPYRHPSLDSRLRRERTRQEARLTSEARRHGVPTPIIRDVNPHSVTIQFQSVGDADLREELTRDNVAAVGRHLARLHDAGIVHGDPTTRNVRVGEAGVFLIDFGLGYSSQAAEDHAMDLHVFGQSLAGTADDAAALQEVTESAYAGASERDELVIDQLREIEGRGRYQ
jgi:N6-L-threonylcarbamoyladenine synthase/protein kinase Bud32